MSPLCDSRAISPALRLWHVRGTAKRRERQDRKRQQATQEASQNASHVSWSKTPANVGIPEATPSLCVGGISGYTAGLCRRDLLMIRPLSQAPDSLDRTAQSQFRPNP